MFSPRLDRSQDDLHFLTIRSAWNAVDLSSLGPSSWFSSILIAAPRPTSSNSFALKPQSFDSLVRIGRVIRRYRRDESLRHGFSRRCLSQARQSHRASSAGKRRNAGAVTHAAEKVSNTWKMLGILFARPRSRGVCLTPTSKRDTSIAHARGGDRRAGGFAVGLRFYVRNVDRDSHGDP